MSDQPDDREPGAPAQRRWTAPLTFFLIVAISAGAYAVALFDSAGAPEPTSPAPAPPAATTSADAPGPPANSTPVPAR